MAFSATDLPISVENVTEMLRTPTKDGGVIHTAGNESRGDGGGGKYVYHATGRSALISSNSGSDNPDAIIDSGFYHSGSGGDDYWELEDKRRVNVRQFGAVGGRKRDDTDAFNRAARSALNTFISDNPELNQIATIIVPCGYYRIRHLALRSSIALIGEGGIADKVNISAWDYAGTCSFTATASNDTFTTEMFPWFNGQPVEFLGGSLPTGITTGVTYYVTSSSHTESSEAETVTFKLSHVPGGPVINLTGDGSGYAIHGRFITDRSNAAKITLKDLMIWGNVWDTSGSGRAASDPERKTPYVYEAISLGPTIRKGYGDGTNTGTQTTLVQWGTGGDLSGVKVNGFENAVGFEVNQNISRMTLCWSERCGQGFRVRGNGCGISNSYATGNRGVAFQYLHSKTLEVDYAVSTVRLWSDDLVPDYLTPVIFFGDDLPAGLTKNQPYFVRSNDPLRSSGRAITTNYGSDINQITCTAHGLVDGMRVWFTGSGLPSNVAQRTKYFIVNATTDTFEIAPVKGGSPLDLGSDATGSNYWYLNSFTVSETRAGATVDLVDNGLGDIRYSVYTTSAADIQGASKLWDIEIEAPFSHTPLTIDSSESLKTSVKGIYWSLLNQGFNFTATAATDVFTAGSTLTGVVGYGTLTPADGLEVYLQGDSLSPELYQNRRYWMRDVSGSNFKLAATEGGAAIDISLDCSGTLTWGPVPEYLVRWMQYAGSLHDPHVSTSQGPGYTKFAMIAEGGIKQTVIDSADDFTLSTLRLPTNVYSDKLQFPNKEGYAVIAGHTPAKSARILLGDWKAVFNGSDRKVELSDDVLIDGTAYTIAFKCTVDTLNRMLAGHSVSTDSYIATFTGANTWRYRGYNSTAYYLDATLPNACNDGNMHTYLLVRSDASTFAFYQDGTLCSAVATGSPIPNGGRFNLIGRQGSTGSPAWFDGEVEYIKAWDRAFTAGEITSAHSGTFPSDALFDMPFIDAAGTTVSDFGSGGLTGIYSGTGTLFEPIDPVNEVLNAITDATADTSPTYDDLIGTVNDPSGTPALRQVTLESLTALVESIIGQNFHSWAIDLDGTDGLCTLGTTVPITGTAYTFSFWVDMDVAGDILMSKNADGNAYIYFVNTTTIYHKCNASGANYASWTGLDDLTSGVHHIVLRRNGDGNDFDLFQNGTKKTTTYSGTVPNNPFTPDLIGKAGVVATLEYNGKVWLVQAWNSALTDTQCQKLYTGIAPASSVLDLRFTEGSGTAVKDFSSQANHGMLSGGYSWVSRT